MTERRWLKGLGLIGFFAFAIGASIVLLSRVGTTVIPQDRYVVQADVRDAVALANAADVRQSGVKIGRVKAIREVGSLIQLQLEIDEKYAPIYNNATTLVRAKSIAEENYIELDPGSPDAGRIPEGGRLPVDRNLEATQNDDVFSIFDRARREGVRRALRGLAPGVRGEGGRSLNRTIESMTALVDESEPFTRILAEERAHTARLIDSFGTVAAALADRKEAIRSLTRSARVAAAAVAARDEQLRATLDSLAPFLDQGRQTAMNLGDFSDDATPVIADLGLAMEDLVPVAEHLGPAAREGKIALASLREFAQTATPTFRALPGFAGSLEDFVPAYERFVRQLNPFVGYLEPYAQEVRVWFALAGAATDRADSIGHVARVLLPISRSSLPATLPPEVEAIISQLQGGLETRGSNAYPLPGEAGGTAPGTGEYTRLKPDPPYTRAGSTR